MSRDDFLADRYFGRLFKEGVRLAGQAGHPPQMQFRCDVSRPQWQRDYLDGLVDVMVVSGELYEKGPRLREMQTQFPVRFWNYIPDIHCPCGRTPDGRPLDRYMVFNAGRYAACADWFGGDQAFDRLLEGRYPVRC